VLFLALFANAVPYIWVPGQPTHEVNCAGEPLDLSDITCDCNKPGKDQQKVGGMSTLFLSEILLCGMSLEHVLCQAWPVLCPSQSLTVPCNTTITCSNCWLFQGSTYFYKATALVSLLFVFEIVYCSNWILKNQSNGNCKHKQNASEYNFTWRQRRSEDKRSRIVCHLRLWSFALSRCAKELIKQSQSWNRNVCLAIDCSHRAHSLRCILHYID